MKMLIKRSTKKLGLLLALLVAGLLYVEPAHAIPAWARRYNADCSMCHTMIPQLNSTGHKFRRLGYRTPEEFDSKEADLSWETLSKLSNYISVRGRVRGVYSKQSGNNTFTFSEGAPSNTPNATIFYAGPLTRNLSMFGEFTFEPDGELEVGQLLANFGSSDGFFFARAGKFHQFSRVGFGGLDRPITLSNPQVFNIFVNGARPRMDGVGVEGGYSTGNLTGLVQVTNGIKATGDAANEGADPNNHKDIAALLEYLIPGHDASVSLLYLYGKAPVPQDNSTPPVAVGGATTYNRLYAFADYTFEPLGLRPLVGGGFGSDNQFVSNVGGAAALVSAARSTSWFVFAELDQRITDKLYGVARFDYWDPTNKAEAASVTAKSWAGTGSLVWSFQKFLRLTGEYTVLDNKFQNAQHAVKAEAQMNF